MSITAAFVVLAVILLRSLLKRTLKLFSYALWFIVFFRLLCPITFKSPLSIIPSNNDTSQSIVYSLDPGVINSTHGIIDIISIIWLIGVAVLAIYAVIEYFTLKMKLSTAELLHDNIYITDNLKTPFIIGFIKPRIIIPADLSDNQTDHIIKHEQTHLKRFDHIIKLFAYAALVIHWFNPVIWFAYFLMVRDMEMSCDESVMSRSDKDIRAGYSNTLLALSMKQSGILNPLSFGEYNVKYRIKNVLTYKRPRFWIVTVCVLAVAFSFIALISDPKKDNSDTVTGADIISVSQTDESNGLNEQNADTYKGYKAYGDVSIHVVDPNGNTGNRPVNVTIYNMMTDKNTISVPIILKNDQSNQY
ncbi:MAG: M56 family metallopeptidase [Clostridia bacterium]